MNSVAMHSVRAAVAVSPSASGTMAMISSCTGSSTASPPGGVAPAQQRVDEQFASGALDSVVPGGVRTLHRQVHGAAGVEQVMGVAGGRPLSELVGPFSLDPPPEFE